MNNPQMYVEELRKLYDCRKIGVSKNSPPFACCCLESCEAAAKGRGGLVKGAEAHVGEKYGDPIRIVVISLDTGGGSGEESGADLCQRRKDIKKTANCEKNPHMRGTIATLKHLYGCRSESDLLTRFAMTNSAKCSGKDKKKDRVPDKLYKNCREHGLAELKELNPQLVVTQGTMARNLLDCRCIDEEEIQKHMHMPSSLTWGDADVRSWICTQVKEHLKYWNNGKRDVPVLQTIHPSAWGQWQRFERTMLPTLAHFLRQWFSCLDDFFRSCKK